MILYSWTLPLGNDLETYWENYFTVIWKGLDCGQQFYGERFFVEEITYRT